MEMLLYGLATGILFGFLLQKAGAVRYDKQLGALRLLDMTIVKFMLSSVLVAMVGVYLLHDLGQVRLLFKPLVLGGNMVGGLLFGLGWGLVGYCPGTAMGALGEGRLDALWGVIGMLAGAALFAETFPFVQQTVLTWGDFGAVTIPHLLGVNHWPVIGGLIGAGLLLFFWFEKKGL